MKHKKNVTNGGKDRLHLWEFNLKKKSLSFSNGPGVIHFLMKSYNSGFWRKR
jgi:hypothetical protein